MDRIQSRALGFKINELIIPMKWGVFLHKALQKIRTTLYNSCNILELLMAVVVLITIIIAGFSLGDAFMKFWNTRFSNDAFLTFTGSIFNILIGIEFLKMLCQPSEDTVLEVLMFLVARHMIIEPTTVYENLVTIISIGLLFAIKKYLNLPSQKGSGNIFDNAETEKK